MNHVVDPTHLAVWREQHLRAVRKDELPFVTESFSNLLENNPIIQWLTDGLSLTKPELIQQLLELHYGNGENITCNDEVSALISWSSPKDYASKRDALLEFGQHLKKLYENSKLGALKIKGLQQMQALKASARGYHINLLLVQPDKQRKGLSHLLLQQLIEKSLARRLPISIELADREQLEIFRHIEFHVVDSYDLPDGPTVWRMNRRPV